MKSLSIIEVVDGQALTLPSNKNEKQLPSGQVLRHDDTGVKATRAEYKDRERRLLRVVLFRTNEFILCKTGGILNDVLYIGASREHALHNRHVCVRSRSLAPFAI